MVTIQLTAGYFFESIKKLFDETYPTKSQKLFEYLSHFELEAYEPIPDQIQDCSPILSVANNIICRGLPTRMSYSLEKKFSEIFSYLEEYKELGGNYFKLNNLESIDQFWEALHIIDPRLKKENIQIDYEQSFEKLGSVYEENFLQEQIPNILGVHFIQLIESQRHLNELLKFDEVPNNLQQNFVDQRVDFSIEYPYKLDTCNYNGVIIEIDGSQHSEPAQHLLDIQRDETTNQHNWQSTRIKITEWHLIHQKLQLLIQQQNDSYFQIIKRNFEKSLIGEWLDILQFVLSPIAIARIQKTLVEAMLRGILNLDSKKWCICFVERDVPCAALALKDIEEFFVNLFSLEYRDRKIPQIDFTVYSTSEFINSELHGISDTEIKNINNFNIDTKRYDVVIDISVLQRTRISPKIEFLNQPGYYFKIRSAHSMRAKRKIISSNLLNYPEFITQDSNGNYLIKDNLKHFPILLEYFLKNIFRKNSFKVGQLPILSRALANNNVIGLLPTGGGKSLTYQLAALLQPGIAVIVDPIKSLMKDQVDGLRRNMIDNSLFINSSLNWKKRKEAHNKISRGEVLFIFISPERLQMEEFRNILQSLSANDTYFSYCIIDEAHCVSEWGHDFRTSYLRLGENATKYCKTKVGSPVAIMGLTATASFDVLSDILREISNHGNVLESDTIVRFETTNRPEIQYEVVPIEIVPPNNDIWTIKILLGETKQNKINELLNQIPHSLFYFNNPINQEEIFNDAYKYDPEREKQFGEFSQENEYAKIHIDNLSDDPFLFYNHECSNAGIIFCPHRGWYFGVTDKYKNPPGSLGVNDNISTPFDIRKGTFIGVDNDNQNINGSRVEEDNIANQDDFINNKLNLLVSTKAFGMGIDKPNIRFTIHLNYPQSIESFVQESGRAGRDGKLALSYILYNDQTFNINGVENEIDKDILVDFHSNSFRGELKEKTIIWELLNTISFPQINNVDRINDHMESQDYDSHVNLWAHNGLSRLYINPNYGFINLNNLHHNNHGVINLIYAQDIYQIIIDYINQNRPQGTNLIQWLTQLNVQPVQDGIQILLQNNQEFNLTIGFTNDWENIFLLISNFLNYLNLHINAETIKNIYGYGNKRKIKFEDFYKALNIQLNIQNKDRLKKLFYRFRDKNDTDKAVYRLSTLGIINEYDVDYRTNTYTIRGYRKTDTELENSLRSYLKKYYSEQRVNNELNNIHNRVVADEFNYLHKCVSFLISFIYREIAKKRKQAIDDMKYACLYRVKSSNKSFKDYIYYYFNSKYARKNYIEDGINKSLYDRYYDQDDMPIDEGDNINVVWSFISFVGSDINNFRHLRGACIRLLQLQPDYFSLNLLKAFSVFSIEQNNQNLLDDGIKSLIKGFNLYFEQIKYNNLNFFSVIDRLATEISAQTANETHPKITNAVSLIKLNAHNAWLAKTIITLEE